MRFDFADLLIEVIGRRASDLHVTAGAPPMVRVRGRLAPLEEFPELTPAETREIAVAALFLADPENSYMNGHILTVDGGWTAGYAREF